MDTIDMCIQSVSPEETTEKLTDQSDSVANETTKLRSQKDNRRLGALVTKCLGWSSLTVIGAPLTLLGLDGIRRGLPDPGILVASGGVLTLAGLGSIVMTTTEYLKDKKYRNNGIPHVE